MDLEETRDFSNTEKLQEDGLRLHNEGYYCEYPRGSKGYYDYWEEQKRRCINGYEADGIEITGYHYYYLNFTQIDRVETDEHGNEVKTMGPPRFYDGDYNFFWAVEIAKNGISEEKYEDLDLAINIDDLSGGNHLAVLKARRKGYTYKAASMLGRNFCMKRNSKNYAMASEKEYLNNDGILSYAWKNINFMRNNTPFGQPTLIDQQMKKKSGYEEKIDGRKVEKGTFNEIIGVSLKNNPDKARGKGGDLGFFEEAGKFPGLSRAWEVCKPSYEQGKYTTGIMIAFGTGGTEDADYRGLESLFNDPESHDVLPINNTWDEGAEDTTCGFFVPAYVNLEGFIDENGNSDVEAAKEYLEKQRDKKKASDDPEALEQHITEFPMEPREATLQTNTNIFPTSAINDHLSSVVANNRHKILTAGRLYRSEAEGVKFKPDSSQKPIFRYPTPKGIDRSGCIVVKETPYRDEEGRVPNNMYIVCHDPYAHDGSPDGSSLGAAYVLKRPNNQSITYMNSTVASYIGRPPTQNEYNRNLFKLAEYYNAKIAFENDRGNVMEYARNRNKIQFLYEKPDIIDNKTRSRRRTTTRHYGLPMSNKEMKNQGEVYIRDWLLQNYGETTDGESKLILHTILDPALLKELSKYNPDGNFDRISALMVGMYYMKDLESKRVVPGSSSSYSNDDFFNRELYPRK